MRATRKHCCVLDFRLGILRSDTFPDKGSEELKVWAIQRWAECSRAELSFRVIVLLKSIKIQPSRTLPKIRFSRNRARASSFEMSRLRIPRFCGGVSRSRRIDDPPAGRSPLRSARCNCAKVTIGFLSAWNAAEKVHSERTHRERGANQRVARRNKDNDTEPRYRNLSSTRMIARIGGEIAIGRAVEEGARMIAIKKQSNCVPPTDPPTFNCAFSLSFPWPASLSALDGRHVLVLWS